MHSLRSALRSPSLFFSCSLLVLAIAGCTDEAGDDDDDEPPILAEGCAAPTGAGTEHQGAIRADETWSAADSPHVVVFDVYVNSGTLTIEPCAVVRLRKGHGISISGAPGTPPPALVAHGESIPNVGAEPTERPVTFERDDASMPWGSIIAYPTGSIDFELVHLDGGGDPDTASNNGGTIIAGGDVFNTGLLRNLRTVNVTIDRSGGFGVNLLDRAGFTADSTNLVITRAGMLPSGSNVDTRYPLRIVGPAVSTIPVGTYTGNAVDEIMVFNASSLLDPELTIHERGVPYRVLGRFGMSPKDTAAAGGLSTLTIEPGVTIKFEPDGGIDLGTSNGSLPEDIWPVRMIAAGTFDKPIVLTSVAPNPAPGAWGGLEWHGGAPDGNVMSYVRIEWAGADSGTLGFGCGPGDNDAALIFRNWRPDDAFITHSTFASSASGGIVRGWRSDAAGPDLVADNTFDNIGNGCNVSRWANGNGSCPSPNPICF